jgi:hypothetical protein
MHSSRHEKTSSYQERAVAGAIFLGHRQILPVVLTMKKSILIVRHQLEITWKNLVIATGFSLNLFVPRGLSPRKGDTGG